MSKINMSRVIEIFADFTDEAEAAQNPHLCRSAISSVESKLKSDCDYEANMEKLCFAAACELYYRYTLVVSANQTYDFTAGDVKVESNLDGLVSTAEKLLASAYADISHLLKSKSFVFRRV